MLKNAEKYHADDVDYQNRLLAKHNLEMYLYSMNSTVTDEKLGEKITLADKETIRDVCLNAFIWLKQNKVIGAGYC